MAGTFSICGRLYGTPKTNIRRGEPAGGKAWMRFTVGCYNFRNKEMEYYYCVIFGGTAEMLARHFHAKRAVSVSGYLGVNTYTPENSEKEYKNIEFCVTNVDFPRDGDGVPPLQAQAADNVRTEAKEKHEEEAPNYDGVTEDGGDLPF